MSGPIDPEPPLLGTLGDSETDPEAFRAQSRRSRAVLKRFQRKVSSSKSSRQCWFSRAEVQVDIGRLLIAHVSGIHRCGSSWSCALCSPVVRAAKAAEIDLALSEVHLRGWTVLLLTLTVRHHAHDPLSTRLEFIAQGNRVIHTGDTWKCRRDKYGYQGSIKSVEILHGSNGWHPHSHQLLIFDRPLSNLEVAELNKYYFGRWSAAVRKSGFGTVTRENGVDLRRIGPGDVIGGYLSKVEKVTAVGWTPGKEIARGDRKKGRGELVGGFELLRRFIDTGETKWLRLWVEYEQATFGKKAIVWSVGLRAKLGLLVEKSDVELAASEGADVSLLSWLIEGRAWNDLIRSGGYVERLEELELLAGEIIAGYDARGEDVKPQVFKTGEAGSIEASVFRLRERLRVFELAQ